MDWNSVMRMTKAFDGEIAADMNLADWSEGKKRLQDIQKTAEAWRADFEKTHGGSLAIQKGEMPEAYSKRIFHTMVFNEVPAFARAAELERRWILGRKMADVVLKAAAAKARSGKWPTEMKDLPVDIYSADGKSPVKYVVRRDGVEVYSVGENGRDDGGIRGANGADDLGVGAVPEVATGR